MGATPARHISGKKCVDASFMNERHDYDQSCITNRRDLRKITYDMNMYFDRDSMHKQANRRDRSNRRHRAPWSRNLSHIRSERTLASNGQIRSRTWKRAFRHDIDDWPKVIERDSQHGRAICRNRYKLSLSCPGQCRESATLTTWSRGCRGGGTRFIAKCASRMCDARKARQCSDARIRNEFWR